MGYLYSLLEHSIAMRKETANRDQGGVVDGADNCTDGVIPRDGSLNRLLASSRLLTMNR